MKQLILLGMMGGMLMGEELFDGKSLAGWEVQAGEEQYWRVEEGAIVGGSREQKVAHNTFVTTKQRFENFDLRLEVKVVGNRPNAGVQFRSERIANHHEMKGYQADVGSGLWGKLYDESRRNRFLATWETDEAAGAAREGWNDLRIRCEGNRVQIWVNEILTVDYQEAEEGIPRQGVIGLQAHSGPSFEVFYRKIVIEDLNHAPKEEAEKVID